jgi:hypothetical protein
MARTGSQPPPPDDAGRERRSREDRPPFFRRWSAVYALVLGFLALLVLLFHLFTRHFR